MTAVLVALALMAQAPAPDTARQARYERALSGISDSLDVVRGAVHAFPLDLDRISPDLVIARATLVQRSCHGASLALDQVATVLAEGVYVVHAKVEQGRLRNGTVELQRTLARCEREWAAPERAPRALADSLREWGPSRGAHLAEALRSYLQLLRAFMKQAALKKPAAS